jgi:hypothetical protein
VLLIKNMATCRRSFSDFITAGIVPSPTIGLWERGLNHIDRSNTKIAAWIERAAPLPTTDAAATPSADFNFGRHRARPDASAAIFWGSGGQSFQKSLNRSPLRFVYLTARLPFRVRLAQ